MPPSIPPLPPIIPPLPAPPLSALTELTPVGATLSTTHSSAYAASNAIDGDIRTLAASGLMTAAADEWISIEVPAGAAIGYVAVYNRDDYASAAAMLNPYELWLTATAGTAASESTSAYRCASGLVAPSIGPYMTWCGGRNDLPYVTLIIRAAATPVRLLSVGEIRVFQSDLPLPTPPPPSAPFPPAQPGASYRSVVDVQFSMNGDVSSFDASQFRNALRSLFEGVQEVILDVVPASIHVQARLVMDDLQHAEAAANNITSTPVAIMQTVWFASLNNGAGIILENVPTPAIRIEHVDTLSPAPPLLLVKASLSAAGSSATSFVVVLYGTLGMLCVLMLMLTWHRRLVSRQRRKVMDERVGPPLAAARSGSLASLRPIPLRAACVDQRAPPAAASQLQLGDGMNVVHVEGDVIRL